MFNRLWHFLDWLGGHELAALVAMLLIVGGVWAFAEIADEVIEGETQSFDERLVRMMRQADDPANPIGPAWLAEVGRDMTAVGGIAVLALVTGSVVGYLVIDRKFRAAVFIVVATFSGLVVSTVLKGAFDRPRPDIVPHLSHVISSSFPSGHSMMSAIVYLTLGALLAGLTKSLRLRVYFIGVGVLLTVLVGVSRVYMGVHYPTDVLAGWTAGLVWATLCWLIERRLQRRGVVEPKE
jgi:undecaprenyl-diphosphatase